MALVIKKSHDFQVFSIRQTMVDQGVQYLYESFGCCQDRDPIFIAIDTFGKQKEEFVGINIYKVEK